MGYPCPLFIPGKCLCGARLDKYGKEDLATVSVKRVDKNSPYHCAYSYDSNYANCPEYKEKNSK